MSRLPLFVANWKMNLSATQAEEFAARLLEILEPHSSAIAGRCELAIAPAFPALDRLGKALGQSGIRLAAQNVHAESEGAFTGEVASAMLEDLQCAFVLVGHSERRQLFGESNDVVQAKIQHLAGGRIAPILCVGETLEEREADTTLEIVENQLLSALEGSEDGLARQLVVAYEPVWAIGTGRSATPRDCPDCSCCNSEDAHRSDRKDRGRDAHSLWRLSQAGERKRNPHAARRRWRLDRWRQPQCRIVCPDRPDPLGDFLMETFIYALHFIVCFVLIAVVLLQRGKGADLGASPRWRRSEHHLRESRCRKFPDEDHDRERDHLHGDLAHPFLPRVSGFRRAPLRRIATLRPPARSRCRGASRRRRPRRDSDIRLGRVRRTRRDPHEQ